MGENRINRSRETGERDRGQPTTVILAPEVRATDLHDPSRHRERPLRKPRARARLGKGVWEGNRVRIIHAGGDTDDNHRIFVGTIDHNDWPTSGDQPVKRGKVVNPENGTLFDQ